MKNGGVFGSAVGILLSSIAFAAPTPLTLDAAFESALKKNATYRDAEEGAVQAQAELAKNRGGLLPTVDFRYEHARQEAITDPLFSSLFPPQTNTSQIAVNQNLFRGGQEYFGLSGLSHRRDAADARAEGARLQLYQEVSEAYLTALMNEQNQKTFSEQAKIQKERVAELKSRTRRGESSMTELLSAQNQEASALSGARRAKADLLTSLERLKFLTGIEDYSSLIDPALLKDPKRIQPLEYYLGGVEKRPDLRAAESEATAAHRMVLGAWGAHMPQLTAAGNYYFVRPSPMTDISWDLKLTLTIPIFSGGATQAAVRKAASERQAADVRLESARREAYQTIRSSYEMLMARVEQVEILKESVGLAEKNVQISQQDFRRGLVRSVDVQDALNQYRETRRTYDEARFNSQIDFVKLETAAAINPPQSKH